MDDKGSFSKEELKRRLDDNELDLSLCSIVKVPVKQISSLQKVTVLDLSCNKIVELPESFCTLANLTQIDLSKNNLVSLPGNFGNLKKLRRLDLYSNKLVSLPLSFGDLTALKWLDLKDNPVQADLPEIVGDCLEPKDCENCAKRMLSFMLEMKIEEGKKRAIAAERERREKAEEEAETQRVNEMRKKEKKEEKERRRRAFLEEQKTKKSTKISNKESLEKENRVDEYQEIVLRKSQKSSKRFPLIILSIVILLLGVALHCYRDKVINFLTKIIR